MLTANRRPVDRDGAGKDAFEGFHNLQGAARRKRSRSSTPTGRWGITAARTGRIPDPVSGVLGPKGERSSWWKPIKLGGWIGKAGVGSAGLIVSGGGHFSLYLPIGRTRLRKTPPPPPPRPGGWRILGVPLCSGVIVRVQSECRS